jgi:hypothetical protein
MSGTVRTSLPESSAKTVWSSLRCENSKDNVEGFGVATDTVAPQPCFPVDSTIPFH